MDNIYLYGGIVFSQRLLLKLTTVLGDRDKAYRIVQRNAMSAYKSDVGFKELILRDKDILKLVDSDEIAECFEIDYYLKNVDKIFKRVFK